MLEKSCGWWLIWYFLFFCHGGAEGQLQWVVMKKVTDYGQNLILFCPVENCCSSEPQAGWSVGKESKILDVTTFSNDPNSKYHATYNTDGFGIVIRNLSEADFNVTYHCNYGFNESTPTSLRHGDVFKENVPDKDKDEENNTVSIVVPIAVIGIVIVAIIIVCSSADEKERLNQQDSPTVVVKQASHSVTTGNNVTFVCTVESSLDLCSVQWERKTDGSITSITTNIEKYKGSTINTPSLTVLNASSSDVGTYTCYASNSAGKGHSTPTTLSVTENPPTVDVKQSSYSVTTGDNVTLDCIVTTSPQIHNVQWQRNIGDSIKYITSDTNIEKYRGSTTITPSLTILNASSSDAGTYICSASSSAGKGHSTPTTLSVTESPPTVKMHQESHYVTTGDDVTLVCTVESSLDVCGVQWQRNSGNFIKCITSDINIEKYKGSTINTPSLTILNASSSDVGTYTCYASNSAGKGHSTHTTLSVTENSPPKPEEFPLIEVVVSAPGQPRNIKVNVLSPNRIKVSWLPPTDSANIRSYNIYFNDSSVMEHPDSNYVLEGLIPDTVYHIQVSAITNGGEGEKSPLIDVKTSPLIGTEGEKRHLTTSDDQIKNEQDLEEINKTGDLEEHLPEDLYGAIVEKYKSEPKIPKDLLDDKMFLSKLLQECGKNTEGLNLDFSGGIDVVYFPATLLVVVMKYRPETKIVEEVVNDMLTTLTSQSPSTVVIVYHRSVKTAKTGVNKEKCQEQTDIFKRFSKKHNFYYNDSSCLQHSIK